MTDCSLADKTCEPCRGGVAPMTLAEAQSMLSRIDPAWSLSEAGHLVRAFSFRNFAGALAFANAVGAIAEEQGHHPDLLVAWGRCGVEIWTHKIGGLAEADFILAAKSDRVYLARE
jgi:4a-hydroxytetrahydrobiopterin dehydratase